MSGSIGVGTSDGAAAVTPQWRPCHTAVPTCGAPRRWRHEACTTRLTWHRRMQQATSCRQCCVACTGPRHRRHHDDSTAWTGAHNKRVLSDLDTSEPASTPACCHLSPAIGMCVPGLPYTMLPLIISLPRTLGCQSAMFAPSTQTWGDVQVMSASSCFGLAGRDGSCVERHFSV